MDWKIYLISLGIVISVGVFVILGVSTIEKLENQHNNIHIYFRQKHYEL